ncbi:MAG: glycine betaine ABC transporter substrate-binding protein [Caldilineaceae bacterium]
MITKHYSALLALFTAIVITTSSVLPGFAAGLAHEPAAPVRQAEQPPASKGKIVVGSRDFTEQLVLGQVLIQVLRDAGYEVEDKTGLGGTNSAHLAIETGEVDIIWDYTGTILSESHGIPAPALPTDKDIAFQMVSGLDKRHHNLIWMTPTAFNDTYTLMMRTEEVHSDLQTIEDLATYMNANDAPLKLCVENEFYSRGDGLFSLQEHYGFAFKEENIELMAYGQLYEGLRNGLCDVAEGFSTDGRISAWNLRNLTDSKQFFPAYNASPIVRAALLDEHPELNDLLDRLGPLLDNATIAQLNAQVDIGADGVQGSGDEQPITEVVATFLRSQRLIKLPEISVAAADATEGHHVILGQMLLLLLENAGYHVVDKTDLGSSNVVRQAMLNGEVDLYMESVATALSAFNGLPVAALPTDRERAYLLAKALDKAHNIVWLKPLAYNESFAVAIQDALGEQGVEDLTQLAQYVSDNVGPLTVCMDNDFYARTTDGLPALEEIYGFELSQDSIRLMDVNQIYAEFANGDCDAAVVSTLDAATRNYTVLADPLHFFLAFDTAPVVRGEALAQNVELEALLNNLVDRIDNDALSQMDQAVELGADGIADSGDEAAPVDVARDFLLANDLLVAATEASVPTAAESPTLASNQADNATATPTPDATLPAVDGPQLAQDNPELSTESEPSTAEAAPVEAGTAADEPSPIIVGSMADTEQQLLGEMLVLMLKDAGYPVLDKTGVGTSPDLRSQLEAGEIDLYPEFTGAALSLYHNIPANALPTNADSAYELVKSLDEPSDIIWLRKAAFDSAYALLVREDLAVEGVSTIADLATYLATVNADLTICVEADLIDKPDDGGLAGLSALYGFTFKPENILVTTLEEGYAALRDGDCDVAELLHTDGRVQAWNFFVLEDTLGAFPSYAPAPVMRRAVLEQYPELETYLGALSDHLNTNTITALNAQVDLGADGELATGDEEDVSTVAESFLCAQGLITQCPESAEVEMAAPEATATILGPVPPVTATNPVAPLPTPTVTPEPLPAPVVIEVTTPETYGVNARASASTEAEVVAVLPRASVVQAVGRTTDSSWLQILLPDNEPAWVFTAAVLTQPEKVAQLPVVIPPLP